MEGLWRNCLASVAIWDLRDQRDWSYHFRPVFCERGGGPFLRNLTTFFVSERMRWENSDTIESIELFGPAILASRIWSLS